MILKGRFRSLFLALFLFISFSSLLFAQEDPAANPSDCKEELRGSTTVPDVLKITTYNVKNLFMLPPEIHALDVTGKLTATKLRPYLSREKPIKRHKELVKLANAILHVGPHIAILQEVDRDAESLSRFVKEYLNNSYEIQSTPGNDGRGINVGFLVKKGLPFHYRLTSHKDEMWKDPTNNMQEEPVFLRDCPLLEVFVSAPKDDGAAPDLAFFGVHLKSRRGRSDADPDGSILRQAESYRAAQIVNRYRAKWGKDVPVFISGDFNGEVNFNAEYEGFRSIGLVNSMDAQKIDVSPHPSRALLVRGTDVFFRGKLPLAEFDHIFVNSEITPYLVGGSIHRPGFPPGFPLTIRNIRKYIKTTPSDHFAVSILLSLKDVLARNSTSSAQ